MLFEPIEPCGVAAEDRGLDRALGRPQRREPVFLLHVLGNFEAPHRLDLPLRGAVPDGIGAPDHVIDAHSLDQRADERGGKLGVRDRGIGKRRAQLGIDVGHAELLRNLRQIGRPLDAAGALELVPGLIGQLEERTQRGMVDDEVHLRPILGGLADVPGGGIFPHAGE